MTIYLVGLSYGSRDIFGAFKKEEDANKFFNEIIKNDNPRAYEIEDLEVK